MPTLLQIAVECNTGFTGTIAEAIGNIAIKNGMKWYEKEQVLPSFDGVRLIYAGNPAKKDLLEKCSKRF